MTSNEALYIRWNEFESGIKHGFSLLRSGEEFTDVTLTCESGQQQMKAHRVILATYSPFFRSLLKSFPLNSSPLLYLRGVNVTQLEYILTFMYNGEVRVRPEDLNDFLAIAQELQVYGLMQQNRSTTYQNHPQQQQEASKTLAINSHHGKTELNEFLSSFCEQNPPEGPSHQQVNPEVYSTQGRYKRHLSSSTGGDASKRIHVEGGNIFGAEELDSTEEDENRSIDEKKAHLLLDEQLSKFVSPPDEEKNYKCLKCSLTSKKRKIVLHHVEAKHFSTNGFTCEKCGGLYKTRQSLSKHKSRIHKKDGEFDMTAMQR